MNEARSPRLNGLKMLSPFSWEIRTALGRQETRLEERQSMTSAMKDELAHVPGFTANIAIKHCLKGAEQMHPSARRRHTFGRVQAMRNENVGAASSLVVHCRHPILRY